MSVKNEIITALLDRIGGRPTVGPNLPEGGVTIIPSGGPTPRKQIDGRAIDYLQIIVTAKSREQEEAFEAVESAMENLTRQAGYPVGLGWQIYSIDTIASANLTGIDAGMYLYSAVAEVTYFKRSI